MNEIDEAIKVLQRYVDGEETALTKVSAHKSILALTAAKEREAVDVEQLKQSYPHEMAMVEGSAGQYDIDMISSYNQAIDDMHERGLLTTRMSSPEREVDVDGLLFDISDSIKEAHGKERALMSQPLIGIVLSYLQEQGHLTSSEKPTHSIQAAKGEGE